MRGNVVDGVNETPSTLNNPIDLPGDFDSKRAARQEILSS